MLASEINAYLERDKELHLYRDQQLLHTSTAASRLVNAIHNEACSLISKGDNGYSQKVLGTQHYFNDASISQSIDVQNRGSQLYVSFTSGRCADAPSSSQAFLFSTQSWMSVNKLKLDPCKHNTC